ncbi:MAG: hypothetical protein H6744_15520 [Deltaproteobacteria bacterium]|nr:hypothetical protein [Deltaproteobacteria bacterium]MCB9788091.1 hypothetical protein [Deltaproteobacteria bacterium]
MRAGSRRALLLACALVSACRGEPPAGEEATAPATELPPAERALPTPADAERFARDLLATDRSRAAAWFRGPTPVPVRTRCESCTPPDIWRQATLATPEDLTNFLGGIAAPEDAAPGRGPMPVRYGDVQCQGSCCTYATGLLDHATLYLTKVCLEDAGDGFRVTALEFIDGS